MSKFMRARYAAFKDRFGTAGVVLGVIALVLALVTGAYAADGGLSGKQKKEVKKIAKKFAGKDGAAGAPGAAGTNGTNGTNGKDGAPGAKGEDGTDGTPGAPGAPGADGKSVEVVGTPDGSGVECTGAGGVVYEVEESGTETEICNGKEGSPWTAGGTLPPGATETGAWAFSTSDESAKIFVPLSFPIQLAHTIESNHVHFQDVPTHTEFTSFCPGSVAEPSAKPGELCVYYARFVHAPENATFELISRDTVPEGGTGSAGAVLIFAFSGAPGEVASGFGSWATKGCSSTPGPNQCP